MGLNVGDKVVLIEDEDYRDCNGKFSGKRFPVTVVRPPVSDKDEGRYQELLEDNKIYPVQNTLPSEGRWFESAEEGLPLLQMMEWPGGRWCNDQFGGGTYYRISLERKES